MSLRPINFKIFLKKISKQIQQIGPKEIKGSFFCESKQKNLTLKIAYELSDVYIDDGFTTDVSVYCNQVLVDEEPLEKDKNCAASPLIICLLT
jgi:hypothetical protein